MTAARRWFLERVEKECGIAVRGVFRPRALELMRQLEQGAIVAYGRPWVVRMGGRRVDVMPNYLAQTWIACGMIALLPGRSEYGITDRGRAALHALSPDADLVREHRR